MTAILNKKVLLAASAIVAVAAIAAGATYAAWQATSSISGNTVSTANLSITAAGVTTAGGNPNVAKPINWSNVLPNTTSSPEERATVTNNSNVALDLWMYFEITENSGSCNATNIAWQSSVSGGGSVIAGYPAGPVPTNPGDIWATGASFNFQTLKSLAPAWGGAPVKIASSTDFGNGAVIAVRQIAGFANNADYGANSGNCGWTEHFVGTLPGVAPVI